MLRMKKIVTKFYIILFLVILSGCETSQSIKYELNRNKVSTETVRTINDTEILGSIDPLGIYKWLGIPFAEKPINDLRWKAPRELKSYNKKYEAVSFAKPCVQFQSSLTNNGLVKPGEIVGSEDCLYLNIYSPPLPKNLISSENVNLPVMVWIHGGGNTTGMPSEYNPEVFVKSENIIFVSVAYRLGIFGWLSHPELRKQEGLNASSNFGLLDQIMALKWIKKNIQFFGGDPNNITIFGESAGGQNVIALYSSPLAKGLFNRAISQSGGTSVTSISDAEKINRSDPNYKSNYKNRHVTSEEWIDVLFKKGLIRSKIYEKNNLLDLKSLDHFVLMSGIDKGEFWDTQRDLARIIADNIVIPREGILETLKDANKHANVPIILGINKDENKLFNFFNKDLVRNLFNTFFSAKDPFYYDLLSDYQSLAWRSNGLDTPADTIIKSGQNNVYTYRFDWDEEPKILGMDFSFLLGAAHAFEIPFIMGDFDLGNQTSLIYDKNKIKERDILSTNMMQYWSEFAKNGDPNKGRNTNLSTWTKWKSVDGVSQIMILDTISSGGVRMINSHVPIEDLVEIFNKDPRSKNIKDKCAFLEIAFSWVDDWKEKNNSCMDFKNE